MIGKSVLRVEDQKFLSGAGRFIDDLSFPGELHCSIVRSPHPHARISGIRAPDGVVMFTGEDMARDGVQPMRCGWVLPGMVEPPRYALARGTVRHVGDQVGAVTLAAAGLEHVASGAAVGQPPVHHLVAAEPVVLLRQAGDRALARQRQGVVCCHRKAG